MKNILSPEAKKIILDKIFLSEYRAVMRMFLDGECKEEIAFQVGYSVRQIERIITACWKEVCILLAEDAANNIREDTPDERIIKFLAEREVNMQ